jgi:hypothetical protein
MDDKVYMLWEDGPGRFTGQLPGWFRIVPNVLNERGLQSLVEDDETVVFVLRYDGETRQLSVTKLE